ncbi:hypothetical protein AB6A40_007345 [Gnathostoma spinigerum]|uniref:mRNA guanylyltransferase n=1 Tax=Gnathostoma spinigerum TaxID=75299 RepID=A0ABD6ET57_9BILA
MFAKYRQGGIYKQDYIDELMKQYGDEDEDRIEAPPRPDWEIGPCTSYEPVDDDVNSSENGLSSLTQSDCKDHPQFMDGLVPCVTYVTDTTTRAVLQNKIKEMCGATKDGFPGCQPVSMERSPDRDNLKLLAENKYMVSWKADGVRYMVLINGENQVYAFDRDNSVFRIPDVSFPHRKENRHIRDTLVDAEMIIDRINDDSGVTKDVPRLLIYDIIKFEGQNVGDCDFRTRLLCIRKEIIGPRKEAMQYGRIRRELEPISIRLKDFWEIETVRKLFDEKFTHNVGHEIDGLIFQPIKEPYKPGRLDTLLKWKPPSHNSIDFKLQIKKVNKVGELPEHIGFLYVQHQPQPMCTMKATKKLLPYNNKIIECNFVNGQWNFMRERTDKSLPNSEKTALAVWNSMRYPIDKATLIEFVEKYCVRREQKRPSEYEHNSQHSKRAALTS